MIKTSKLEGALPVVLESLYFTAEVTRTAGESGAFMLEILHSLRRYASEDWGYLCAEDRGLNDQALRSGTRLLGAYNMEHKGKIWIITEAKDDEGRRSAMAVLIPDKY